MSRSSKELWSTGVFLHGASLDVPDGESTRRIFGDLDLALEPGLSGIAAITGPSGCGKTSLLTVMAGTQLPTDGVAGVYSKDGSQVHYESPAQFPTNLINQASETNLPRAFTVGEYLHHRSILGGSGKLDQGSEPFLATLNLANLSRNILDSKCSALSGGEKQRVALLGALAASYRPNIFADEPTGALDHEASQGIVDLMGRFAHEHGRLVIAVTHDRLLIEAADIQITYNTNNSHFGKVDIAHTSESQEILCGYNNQTKEVA